MTGENQTWVLRVMCRDGTLFEVPVKEDMNVGMFLNACRSTGSVSTHNWFIPYESVLWACSGPIMSGDPVAASDTTKH